MVTTFCYAIFLCLFAIGIISCADAKNRRHLLESTSSVTEIVLLGNNYTVGMDGKNSSNFTTISTPTAVSVPDHQVAADVMIAIITIIVLGSIIIMAVYFIRKFHQLNQTVPTYRYSSLKTEINGSNGCDDKIDSNSLVEVSTEEEEDFDIEVMPTAPTLIVQSQMTFNHSKTDCIVTVPSKNIPLVPSANASEVKETVTIDSDDELLQ